MKYCVYCGHQVEDEAKFCPGCGKPLNQPAATPSDKKEEGGAAIVGLCLSGRKKVYKGGPFGLTGFITSLVGLFVSLIAIIIVIAALTA